MIIIQDYRKERREDGKIYILSDEDSACPLCLGLFIVIGVRDRKVTDGSDIKEILVIRRLRCDNCKKIHHELPDMIVPYKRHCAETVEKVITGDAVDICCDFVTEYRIKRWWAAFRLYFESVKVSLQVKYGAVFSANPALREIVRAIANTNLWVHTRTAMTPI
jgi:hypothetical protein